MCVRTAHAKASVCDAKDFRARLWRGRAGGHRRRVRCSGSGAGPGLGGEAAGVQRQQRRRWNLPADGVGSVRRFAAAPLRAQERARAGDLELLEWPSESNLADVLAKVANEELVE
eukprot:8574395-Alexandrium_andersonii.AAC.1